MNVRRGVDLDGVVADFNRTYADRLVELTGRNGFGEARQDRTTWPPIWAYERRFGYTSEEVGEVWRQIARDRGFWRWLHPLPGAQAVLGALMASRYQGDEVIFITSRPGDTAKLQTEQWLQAYGFGLPTVLISSSKGACCAVLGIHSYIDDKLGNVNDVRVQSPGTRVYLLDQPYNQLGLEGNDALTLELGVERVRSLEEYLKREGL